MLNLVLGSELPTGSPNERCKTIREIRPLRAYQRSIKLQTSGALVVVRQQGVAAFDTPCFGAMFRSNVSEQSLRDLLSQESKSRSLRLGNRELGSRYRFEVPHQIQSSNLPCSSLIGAGKEKENRSAKKSTDTVAPQGCCRNLIIDSGMDKAENASGHRICSSR